MTRHSPAPVRRARSSSRGSSSSQTRRLGTPVSGSVRANPSSRLTSRLISIAWCSLSRQLAR
jgi:hypothetical protein